MKRVYTWSARPAVRTVTIAGMQAAKGTQKWTQVTANSAEEALAANDAGLDMIICNSQNVEAVRSADTPQFLTAAIALPNFATEADILRETFRALSLGADAIMTARSMKIVEMLAMEDVPVMGHLGLVPRKSTWSDGLRAIGGSGREAFELYRRFKRLEEAGGVLVEAEVIPGPVMLEISGRSALITVSLGSGSGADVDYLFMEDICGDSEKPPRHARAFGNLRAMREELRRERRHALSSFRVAAERGEFPGDSETVAIDQSEFEEFLLLVDGDG
ncbi:MAG: 3-methyl-2-oxobutanoate hydroxymethyltransferase [Rhodobacteraceae bacterium]|nr:3-methyl-2-oxobutanoate hydroxymethyltransferase [Paracoccaceae bacterium]